MDLLTTGLGMHGCEKRILGIRTTCSTRFLLTLENPCLLLSRGAGTCPGTVIDRPDRCSESRHFHISALYFPLYKMEFTFPIFVPLQTPHFPGHRLCSRQAVSLFMNPSTLNTFWHRCWAFDSSIMPVPEWGFLQWCSGGGGWKKFKISQN